MLLNKDYDTTSKFSLEYVIKKSREYLCLFTEKTNNQIGKLKILSIIYTKEIPYFHAPFWIIDFELVVTKKISCYFKTILISDLDGTIIEVNKEWEHIDGKTMLSKEAVLNIANEYLKKKHSKTKYRIHTDKSYYLICRRNSKNMHDSIWCVAFSDISNNIVAENITYLQILDSTDNK